jgi:hypothetical protein
LHPPSVGRRLFVDPQKPKRKIARGVVAGCRVPLDAAAA